MRPGPPRIHSTCGTNQSETPLFTRDAPRTPRTNTRIGSTGAESGWDDHTRARHRLSRCRAGVRYVTAVQATAPNVALPRLVLPYFHLSRGSGNSSSKIGQGRPPSGDAPLAHSGALGLATRWQGWKKVEPFPLVSTHP